MFFRIPLEIANIGGALSTQDLGGISAFPNTQELAEFEARYAKQRRSFNHVSPV